MMLGCTGDSGLYEGDENPGYSSAVQGVISTHGAIDLAAYREPRGIGIIGGIGHRIIRSFLQGLEGVADPYAEASPRKFLSETTCPVLLLHGTKDVLVPLEVVERFAQDLEAHGIPVTLERFPGRNHSFDRINAHTRRELFAKMKAFLLQRNLLPAPAARPG
jgi:acetyl esterase/lipase